MSLKELYLGCRTYRRFKQTPIDQEILVDLVDCARISSSAANKQPIYYVVINEPEHVKAFQPLVKWAAALPKELGTPKEGEQPTAFIVMVKRADAIPFADVDVGIAAHALTLRAYEQGIGSCMMGSINVNKIKEICAIPEEDNVRLVIALGYPDHKSTIVNVPDDGSLNYYLDDQRQYYVPKRSLDDVLFFEEMK